MRYCIPHLVDSFLSMYQPLHISVLNLFGYDITDFY